MIIGIDATRANAKHKTGVEWYGYHVIRELAKLDHENSYRLYSWEPLRGELAVLPENFENVLVPNARAWPHTALSVELKQHPLDALFVPSHVVPRIHPQKTVVTIHDIGFRLFRENYSAYHYASLQIGTRLSARWASDIAVPSQGVADDVTQHYPAAAGKVSVVPNGVDLEPFQSLQAADVVAVMKRWRINDPYLLYLGRLETRKNVVRILEAFYRLKDSGLFGGQLVLAGNPGTGYEAIREVIKERRQPGDVIQPGYVSTPEAAALMAGARAFVFPSLHEGFGIPVLESFAASTPVLTADRGALAEVAGQAALLVDPEDTGAIHHGLERLLAEPALVDTLVEAGHRRLHDFSWHKTTRHIHRLLTS